MRAPPLLLVALLLSASVTLLGGCDDGPESAGPPAVAPTDKEVSLVTKPAGADVLIGGAKVGTTPMTLTVRDETNVVLEKPGYIKQATLVTPDGESEVSVELAVSDDVPEVPGPDEDLPADAPAKVKKKKKPRYNTMRKIKTAHKAGRITRPQYDKYRLEIRRKRQVEYDKAKDALRSGRITKPQYKKRTQAIRRKYEG